MPIIVNLGSSSGPSPFDSRFAAFSSALEAPAPAAWRTLAGLIRIWGSHFFMIVGQDDGPEASGDPFVSGHINPRDIAIIKQFALAEGVTDPSFWSLVEDNPGKFFMGLYHAIGRTLVEVPALDIVDGPAGWVIEKFVFSLLERSSVYTLPLTNSLYPAFAASLWDNAAVVGKALLAAGGMVDSIDDTQFSLIAEGQFPQSFATPDLTFKADQYGVDPDYPAPIVELAELPGIPTTWTLSIGGELVVNGGTAISPFTWRLF